MTWKRVRQVGGKEGALELEPISGATVGRARSGFLVPEDEALDCCRRANEKPFAEPEKDSQVGFLIVPAEHVEEAHPEQAGK